MARSQTSRRRFLRPALIGACVLLLCSIACVPLWLLGCLPDWTMGNPQPHHQRLMAGIHLGSGVRSLDAIYLDPSVWQGDVRLWIAAPDSLRHRSDTQLKAGGQVFLTEYGAFRKKDLGSYSRWRRSAVNIERFTGEVIFFIHQPFCEAPFGNSVAIAFTYVDGRLMRKDWGFLPG